LPTLGFAQGSSFLNPHPVAYFARIFFVVNFIAAGLNYDFAVLGVRSAVFYGYYHSFFAFYRSLPSQLVL